MKRILCIILILLCLYGCATHVHDSKILVMIEQTEGCTIENSRQYILPGQDVTFHLTFDYGISLSSVDYPGAYRTESEGKSIILTLEQVTYPTRVKLSLTHKYTQITYHANGGAGIHTSEDTVSVSYSLLQHSRPNTDTGANLFRREGYTLVGWNTESDGSGIGVGLGSRISVSGAEMSLYAQWKKWNDPVDFTYAIGDTAVITGYHGNADTVVIPAQLDGLEVTGIAPGAFIGCAAETIVLPISIDHVEPEAFQNCSIRELVLFDNIVTISDSSFSGCSNLQTLRINAIEAPFGYHYRRESCYADKIDLLMNAQGQKKLVFYGGCSMWYNLDSSVMTKALGDEYAIINLGLNGTVNSLVQMQIMGHYLEEGDILLHTPELSSRQQLLTNTDMRDTDSILWSGLENNYDLFTLVDLRSTGGVFDSFCAYLNMKDTATTYTSVYTDDQNRTYMDSTGSIPFFRGATKEELGDKVYLDPGRIDGDSMSRLDQYYQWFRNKGVRIYISYAVVNLDAVPEDQRKNAPAVERVFQDAIAQMDGPVLISQMKDFIYTNSDFYDTNYHLLSLQASRNTEIWLRDLLDQIEADGITEGDGP